MVIVSRGAGVAVTRNLLHVGYPKAASSFLQQWFVAHPELHYSHGGIGGFTRSSEIHDHIQDSAAAHIRYLVTSDEDLSFWRGPVDRIGAALVPHDVKSHQSQVCQVLRSLVREPVVLIVTRGYASILRSAYSQYLAIGGTLTFDEFVDGHIDLMVDFWDYSHLIDLYSEAFGSDSVLVRPFESMRDDPFAFLGELEASLGLSTTPVDARPVKASIPTGEMGGYRRLSRMVTAAARPLPAKLERRVHRSYSQRLAQRGLAPLRRLAGVGQAADTLGVDLARLRCRFSASSRGLSERQDYEPYRAAYFLD